MSRSECWALKIKMTHFFKLPWAVGLFGDVTWQNVIKNSWYTCVDCTWETVAYLSTGESEKAKLYLGASCGFEVLEGSQVFILARRHPSPRDDKPFTQLSLTAKLTSTKSLHQVLRTSQLQISLALNTAPVPRKKDPSVTSMGPARSSSDLRKLSIAFKLQRQNTKLATFHWSASSWAASGPLPMHCRYSSLQWRCGWHSNLTFASSCVSLCRTWKAGPKHLDLSTF